MGSCVWSCPLCNKPLLLEKNRWLCPAQHSFDVAKEGYVNLLPAQHKSSRSPGDSKAMIQARRAFLKQGYYAPLARSVGHTLAKLSPARPDKSQYSILDCGCGEGYYTAQFRSHTPAHAHFFGLDISKPAIKLASKSYKNIHFAVASAFAIPLPDHSLDSIVQIFAPSADEHIRLKLRPGGTLIRVSPGENHLIELRNAIYEKTKAHVTRPLPAEYFSLSGQETCGFTMQLNNNVDIENLLKMTPHFWQASAHRQESLLQKDSMLLTADFVISRYTRAA